MQQDKGFLTCHGKVTCYGTSCLNSCSICVLGNSIRSTLQTSNRIIASHYYLPILHLLYILLLRCMCGLSDPRVLENQFTFYIKHHIHVKRTLYITGLSNTFKWISVYNMYSSNAPSGLVGGFLYLSIWSLSNLLPSGNVLCVEFIVPLFCSQNELPEPEQDNGGTTESVKEQEMKWTDLALQYLHENVPPTGN